MDKGLMRFKKGRVGIAIAIAACMLIALPASAFAASNFFPADGGSITAKSPVVSLVFSGSNLDARTATIMLGATALPVQTSATNGGSWSTGDPVLVNGVYKMSWQWTPGTLTTGQVKAWAFLPSATPTGTVSLTASIKDTAGAVADAGAWSFTLVGPTATTGGEGGNGSTIPAECSDCHSYSDAGMHDNRGDDCSICHSGADAPSHGYITGTRNHASVEASLAANSSGCVSCHGSAIDSVLPGEHAGCLCHTYGEATASVDQCEDCHIKPMDPTAPYPYHVGDHAFLETAMADKSDGCVSCHGSNLLNVATGEHANCSCHAYHEAEADKDQCEDCHVQPMDPAAPYPYHVGDHATVEAGIAGDSSEACTKCHGTDLLDVGLSQHTDGEHAGCSCHAYEEAVPANDECVACHKDGYAPHGFADGSTHTSTSTMASGHNTEQFGRAGGYTKFDGSQGPVVKNREAIAGTESTSTQDWPLPTYNVFWEAGDPEAPLGAMTGLSWTSEIGCEDCHGNLDAAGPHGSSAVWSLDPNYPAPFEKAVLSNYTTSVTGIRYRSSNVTGGTDAVFLDAVPGTSTGIICQKCHDLYNNNGLGVGGASNTAHDSHHQDTNDGSADCISCHIAVPHGWKRPRMLVVASDPAPYKSPATRGSIVPAGITGAGNWSGVGARSWYAGGPLSLNASGGVVWDRGNCDGCTGIPGSYYGTGSAGIPGSTGNHQPLATATLRLK